MVKRVAKIFISLIYLIYLQVKFCFTKRSDAIYCTVIFYHSIPYDKIDRFKKQINILNKLTTPIPLSCEGSLNNKLRYSIVTFDDAFKSIINNAVPVLEKAKTPFALFIPAGQLDKNPGWLKDTGYKDEFEVVASAEELLRIPSKIATFGSHTINHYDLTQIKDNEALTEIKDSKKILESMLKREVNYFSFPYGRYTGKILDFCNEAGYTQVLGILPESPFTPLKSYIRGRIEVDPSDWYIEFIVKILGGYGWRTFSSSTKK